MLIINNSYIKQRQKNLKNWKYLKLSNVDNECTTYQHEKSLKRFIERAEKCELKFYLDIEVRIRFGFLHVL